tara:strand:+ start:2959 stop:3663 length:705 start_codon:yes stop_codon:yes gene_type:complete
MRYLSCLSLSLFFTLLIPQNAFSQLSEPKRISLEQGLALALQNNELLRIARADLTESRQQIRETTAGAFPQLYVLVSYNRNWLLPNFIFETSQGRQSFTEGTHNNLEGVLSLRQSLYTGGKVNAARRAVRAFSEFSTEALRATRQRVRAQVEIAFNDLILARELLRVSRLALERSGANLDRVKRLRRTGRVSDYDLLRADSIQAANGLTLSRLAFKNSIGLAPDETLESLIMPT